MVVRRRVVVVSYFLHLSLSSSFGRTNFIPITLCFRIIWSGNLIRVRRHPPPLDNGCSVTLLPPLDSEDCKYRGSFLTARIDRKTRNRLVYFTPLVCNELLWQQSKSLFIVAGQVQVQQQESRTLSDRVSVEGEC